MNKLNGKDENKQLSREVTELQKEAVNHLENSKSENTKRAYRSDWDQFDHWCQQHGFVSLPADPETLVYYITYLGQSHKASTIKRKMAAIS